MPAHLQKNTNLYKKVGKSILGIYLANCFIARLARSVYDHLIEDRAFWDSLAYGRHNSSRHSRCIFFFVQYCRIVSKLWLIFHQF